MATMGVRLGALLAACLLTLTGCGGEAPEAANEPAASDDEDDFEAPPIEVPKKCPEAGTEYELWTHAASWANEDIKPYEPGEACLVVPAGEPFTVVLHNPKSKGVLNFEHNFATYADSVALEMVFRSDPVKKDEEKTIDVPAMDAGTYLFRCDFHARYMKGVIVVE
jgi:Cupredoxin-like domain